MNDMSMCVEALPAKDTSEADSHRPVKTKHKSKPQRFATTDGHTYEK